MIDLSIYDYESAPLYVRAWMASLPKQGRGSGSRLAEHLGVSPTMVSQILSGEKGMSPETGVQIAEFIGMNDRELDFFLLLVEKERAGHQRLKSRLDKKIKAARKESETLAKRVEVDQELDSEAKAIYYSSWLFTAIRNLTALPDIKDLESLSAHLGVPRANLVRVLQFLIEKNLVESGPEGLLYKNKWTHIPANSPLVVKHHQNWRVRGLSRMDDFRDEDFFFTGPMSMSRATAAEIRARLPEWIERIQKEVGPSPSEVVKCLNIDWFGF